MDLLVNVLLSLPKPVWITIAVIFAVIVLISVVTTISMKREEDQRRREKEREEEQRRREKERDRLVRERAAAVKRHQQEAARQKKQQAEQRAAALAADKRKQEERARLEDKQRVGALGKQGAALVKRANSSVQRIVSSEAAQEGWLGDVDFTPDIEEIEANLRRARALRGKSDDLSALPKPNDDDRKIIAEAKTTIALLERKTKERVELLQRCASEAHLIDESLRKERDEVQLAAKREELHGELAAMLYGIEAAGMTPVESAADAVMARVQAYRDIKGQIERARDDTEAPTDAEDKAGGDSSVEWIVDPIRQAWKWVVD
jgi:DNA-binding helix-hairpin-helix protein with protein kinase domain